MGFAALGTLPLQTASATTTQTTTPRQPIPKRPLGKTRREVTIYGLGGLFTTSMHDRDEVFLASKSHDYTYDGTISFIGVTGHSSRVLADALENYPYDCALITLNAAGEVMDDTDDLDRFFQVAQEREVGVIAMKVAVRGALIRRGLSMQQLLPWVLSHPVSTAVVGISDVAHLEENVRVASGFKPLGEEEMAEIQTLATSRASQ